MNISTFQRNDDKNKFKIFIPLLSTDFSSIKTQAEAPSDNCDALPAVMVAEGSASNLTGCKPEISDNFVPGRLHYM